MSKSNPGLYREMSAPFASADEANTALSAFYEDLYELRRKHRMTDVLCIVQVNVALEGDEAPMMSRMHIGNSLNALPLSAYAYGAESSENEQRIAYMLAKGKKVAK